MDTQKSLNSYETKKQMKFKKLDNFFYHFVDHSQLLCKVTLTFLIRSMDKNTKCCVFVLNELINFLQIFNFFSEFYVIFENSVFEKKSRLIP